MHVTRRFEMYRQCGAEQRKRSPENRFLSKVLLSLDAIGILALIAVVGCEKKGVAGPPPPPEVAVANVVQQNVPVYAEWVALLNGPVNADITPKVQGYLLRQNYQNGFFVKKGQLLFTLDPRQYQAALDEAKAQVATAQANLAKADEDVARDTPLAAQRAIPKKDLDTDITTQAAMTAQVQAAKAGLDNAELNLAWTKVYSPIDGIAGASNSQVGDLVGTTTKMVTVSQVDPIWAYFNPSESLYLKFAPLVTRFITDKVRSGAGPQQVELIQANDQPYPQKGRIIYVNRQIGTGTGTIQMAAAFPNPNSVLRPGGYGRVRLRVGDNQNALLVPQPAVIEVQSDYMVFVIGPDNKARFRPVKMGDRVGPNWIVTGGLKPGERVVAEGIERLQMFAAAAPQMAKEGIPVVAKPYVPASAPTGGGN
jgi:RND family efflux transporter MFP subunit